ncbi:hypothetical protein HNO88_004246 [Novosphingobium chloroacetimidivorans]|uniref:TonB C-terminal domain-containing protein n=1 Tax=Novosphingobium chloroacetimidivorans TaxID=1428314 RepID=A0A7W7NZ50_9SPHN|nr:hypothetical protein [Novosphingobium chloroacetimidivorans]MBB4860900.1 hypothetical protein [Novosphingobium chloroacetimidivorans]
MKGYLSATLPVAFIICASATGASTQSAVTSIQAPPTLATWSTRVMNDLKRGLRVRNDLGARGPSEGLVTVKFNCSENGAPSKIELLKSIG